jgi:plasmid stabilization system protein ParE
MRYRVRYSGAVIRHLTAQIDWLVEQQVPAATIKRWYGDLLEAIDQLAFMPNRQPLSKWTTPDGRPVRKLIFGDHIILFVVNEREQVVTVLQFRHGARQG